MREVKKIILHCSDSEWGDAAEIDKWHKARGWQGIVITMLSSMDLLPVPYLPTINRKPQKSESLNWDVRSMRLVHTLLVTTRPQSDLHDRKKEFHDKQIETALQLVEALRRVFNFPWEFLVTVKSNQASSRARPAQYQYDKFQIEIGLTPTNTSVSATARHCPTRPHRRSGFFVTVPLVTLP